NRNNFENNLLSFFFIHKYLQQKNGRPVEQKKESKNKENYLNTHFFFYIILINDVGEKKSCSNKHCDQSNYQPRICMFASNGISIILKHKKDETTKECSNQYYRLLKFLIQLENFKIIC